MRIVIVNAHFTCRTGGSELQCHLIARELGKRGHEVSYVAIAGAQADPPLPYKTVSVPPNARRIAEACIHESPDVVYWRHNKRCFLGAVRLLGASDIPVVFAVSHVADTTAWASKRSLREDGFLGWTRVAKDMVRSRWNHQGFRYVNGVVVNNADHLWQLPVPLQVHIANSYLPPEATAGFVPWPRPYCLWVANLKPQKRPELFARLAERLNSSVALDFLMIGNDQRGRYRSEFSGAATASNFYYLGPRGRSEVAEFVRASRFVVHTCRDEGFPNIFIEAWHAGKPVLSLSFDPEGLLETESIGRCAGSFDAFVDHATAFALDEALCNEIGVRALAFATARFDLESNVSKLERFLTEAIESARRYSLV